MPSMSFATWRTITCTPWAERDVGGDGGGLAAHFVESCLDALRAHHLVAVFGDRGDGDVGAGFAKGEGDGAAGRAAGADDEGALAGEVEGIKAGADFAPFVLQQRHLRGESHGREAAGEAAAIDDEALAGDVAGGVGGEEDGERAELPRFAKALRGEVAAAGLGEDLPPARCGRGLGGRSRG